MLADAIEQLSPEIGQYVASKSSSATLPRQVHAEALLVQLVAVLRGGKRDESDPLRLTLDADTDAMLSMVRALEDATVHTLEARGIAATVREMHVLGRWFASLREDVLREVIRLFTETLDALPDEIQIQRERSRIVLMNRALADYIEALTGRKRVELAGCDSLALMEEASKALSIPSSFNEHIRDIETRAWQGEGFQGDFLVPTTNGMRWRSNSVAPVRSADGSVEAIAVVSRDVHEQRLAEARLRVLSKIGTLHEVGDEPRILAAIARIALPELADWCIVSTVEGEQARAAHVSHRDETQGPTIDALLGIERAQIESTAGRVLTTEELAQLERRLGARSAIVVPVFALGSKIAEVLFVFAPASVRDHKPDDLQLAQEMGRRAGQIIENLRLQEKLQRSEARFRFALSSSNISVFEEDADFVIDWIYNSPFGDLTGTTVAAHAPASVVAELEALKRRVISTGEGATTTADFHVGDRQLHLLLRYEPQQRAGGVRRIIGSAVDVTEMKRVQDELSQALDFRERVMGVLGHDLRNPLGAVMGIASVQLRRKELPEFVREGLNHVLRAGQRMNEIIESVLDFTRLRFGAEMLLTTGSADLAGIARAVVDELRVSHADRVIDVRTSGAMHGTWDGGRLGQVVSNLVGNALAHGAREQPVLLSLLQRHDAVEMVVENRGPTIPADQLEHLFEPFWQAPTESAMSRRKGLGLGLWIVREIVRLHGGTIDVRSVDGTTSFTVRLPRTTAESGTPASPDGL